MVATAIGTWSFSAHALTDDELLYSALLMLKHALQVAELEHWRMTDGKIVGVVREICRALIHPR